MIQNVTGGLPGMAKVTTMYSGVKMGPTIRQASDHQRAKRGDVIGWSRSAAKRNLEFLQTVVYPDLSGLGYAVTLTVRDCPPTAADFQKLRTTWLRRVERLKGYHLLRTHWVIEFTKRGVPHIHTVLYFADHTPPGAELYPRGYYSAGRTISETDYSAGLRCDIVRAWLQVAGKYGADTPGQHIVPVSDARGWLDYLAKHSVRGVYHYQRARDSLPATWQKTGRLWGYTGDWPTVAPLVVDTDDPAGFKLRRVLRGLHVADTRGQKHATGKQIARARSWLKYPYAGAVRWLPDESDPEHGLLLDLRTGEAVHKTRAQYLRELRFRSSVRGVSTGLIGKLGGQFVNYLDWLSKSSPESLKVRDNSRNIPETETETETETEARMSDRDWIIRQRLKADNPGYAARLAETEMETETETS